MPNSKRFTAAEIRSEIATWADGDPTVPFLDQAARDASLIERIQAADPAVLLVEREAAWRALTRRGDPLHRLNLFHDGWNAAVTFFRALAVVTEEG